MKIPSIVTAAALVVGLLLCGCANGISTRIQEKSEVFAKLPPEQQKSIRGGTVEPGYTADMVYMALGKPTQVKVKDTAHGKVGFWIYHNFYPEGYEEANGSTGETAASRSTNASADMATPPAAKGKGGRLADTGSGMDGKVSAPPAGVVADDAPEHPPAASSFSNPGSADYGFSKTETPKASYTNTGLSGYSNATSHPFIANESSFDTRSGAMEPLDVPEMDSASLYVVFFEGRVVSMKLGKN